MSTEQKQALIEVAKSMGRFLWFGFLGLLVLALGTVVSSGALNDIAFTVAGQSFSVGFILVATVTGLAKAIDRYVHENQDIKANGIAPEFLQK
jgi:hypothetical protein